MSHHAGDERPSFACSNRRSNSIRCDEQAYPSRRAKVRRQQLLAGGDPATAVPSASEDVHALGLLGQFGAENRVCDGYQFFRALFG